MTATVSEEIRKQKLAVEKQQRAKLEEIQTSLRKMDHLQLKQRTSEATASWRSEKGTATLASNNIKEFASDVETDKLSLEHVSFIKNLLNLEDVKKGDSFWWKRMDETVLALERMSESINKPEELERVLVELKEVLQKTTNTTKKLLKSDDDSDMAESTQFVVFRSRIDDIIVQDTSKVTTAVTSNVKDYVDTLKEETEALSSIVQEELDDVADAISRNLPFVVGLNTENKSDPETQAAADYKKDRHDVFADAAASERIEGEWSQDAEEQWERLKHEQRQWEEENMLRHDPLFPPGRILYLNRVVAPGPSPKAHNVSIKSSEKNHKVPDVVEFVEVATDEFGRVVLSNRMLLDHLCTDYERVLQSQAKLLEPAP
ncbi:hypothetical protein P3T76_016400 [Phytophthora citrophthora]|uniref:Uncharacterized protein n=1 Tax=Phytophthora citrophthora TaxID=4793 RepID=A0AAD9FXQ9_9STRA|nr:hypothetical protein P3T76_016400 [Phytophthora citrophthora]